MCSELPVLQQLPLPAVSPPPHLYVLPAHEDENEDKDENENGPASRPRSARARAGAGAREWGEPLPQDVLQALTDVRAERQEAQRRARRAAALIHTHMSWAAAVARISSLLQAHGI